MIKVLRNGPGPRWPGCPCRPHPCPRLLTKYHLGATCYCCRKPNIYRADVRPKLKLISISTKKQNTFALAKSKLGAHNFCLFIKFPPQVIYILIKNSTTQPIKKAWISCKNTFRVSTEAFLTTVIDYLHGGGL